MDSNVDSPMNRNAGAQSSTKEQRQEGLNPCLNLLGPQSNGSGPPVNHSKACVDLKGWAHRSRHRRTSPGPGARTRRWEACSSCAHGRSPTSTPRGAASPRGRPQDPPPAEPSSSARLRPCSRRRAAASSAMRAASAACLRPWRAWHSGVWRRQRPRSGSDTKFAPSCSRPSSLLDSKYAWHWQRNRGCQVRQARRDTCLSACLQQARCKP
mmetsp:Transcript_49133/g.140989  ORF Transcript_49133/g.140989 Transcript_49133/m.140989 type:complete len:211 (-) Transcript_49133:723-1355(-)